MSDLEKRVYTGDLEIREAHDGEPATISGYAAVFNSYSRDLGGFREIVEPGAFRETLASNPDVRAALEHGNGLYTLGRTTNGTLLLKEDDRGLWYEVSLPDTQAARDTLALIKRGDINQSSFKFRVKDDTWQRDADGYPLRRLRAIDLQDGDVSPVSTPAYTATSVSAEARSMVETMTHAPETQPDTTEELEQEQPTEAGEVRGDTQARINARKRYIDIEQARILP